MSPVAHPSLGREGKAPSLGREGKAPSLGREGKACHPILFPVPAQRTRCLTRIPTTHLRTPSGTQKTCQAARRRKTHARGDALCHYRLPETQVCGITSVQWLDNRRLRSERPRSVFSVARGRGAFRCNTLPCTVYSVLVPSPPSLFARRNHSSHVCKARCDDHAPPSTSSLARGTRTHQSLTAFARTLLVSLLDRTRILCYDRSA